MAGRADRRASGAGSWSVLKRLLESHGSGKRAGHLFGSYPDQCFPKCILRKCARAISVLIKMTDLEWERG